MIEWNIQSRARGCQQCERAFRPQENLHTLLFDERQGYQRIDVCEECWQSQYSQAVNHRKGFVSHWLGIHAPPPAHAPEAIQKESAETLLRKLLETNDQAHAGAIFVLAVMLERKRILKVKAQTTDEGRRILVYEHVRSGDILTLGDPNLQLDQLEAVQRDVADLLEHGLRSSEADVVTIPAGDDELATPFEIASPPAVL